MPSVKTPQCSKLKSLRDVSGMLSLPTALLLYWWKIPFLSLSCAIIWRSMGKVAWSFLWPCLHNCDPAWHDERFVLNGLHPSSMASGDVFTCPHRGRISGDKKSLGDVLIISEYCRAFCLLPRTLPALLCSTTPTLVLLPLCPTASANQIPDFAMCLIWRSSHCVRAWDWWKWKNI